LIIFIFINNFYYFKDNKLDSLDEYCVNSYIALRFDSMRSDDFAIIKYLKEKIQNYKKTNDELNEIEKSLHFNYNHLSRLYRLQKFHRSFTFVYNYKLNKDNYEYFDEY
jgi:hypothetical protein